MFSGPLVSGLSAFDSLNINLLDVIDVFLVAILLYQGYKFIAGTSAMNLIRGVIILLLLWFVATIFNLALLGKLVSQLSTVGLFAFIVLFQPELRALLEQVGRSRTLEHSSDAAALTEIIRATEHLAERKIGALIAIERRTPLGEHSDTGTQLDAKISAPFIEALFARNGALHDGGVVVRGSRVVAAGCLFPLDTADSHHGQHKRYGTRHRAALGLSAQNDAVVLIVSEERGSIRLAVGGILTPNLSITELRERLTLYVLEYEDLSPEHSSPENTTEATNTTATTAVAATTAQTIPTVQKPQKDAKRTIVRDRDLIEANRPSPQSAKSEQPTEPTSQANQTNKPNQANKDEGN